MAKSIPVKENGQFIYSIELASNFSGLIQHLSALTSDITRKICIVTDSNVAPLYAKELSDLLKTQYKSVHTFIFQAGENNKNLKTVNSLYEFLIQNHFDRKDLLIALGGGVVGDLTGFAAATYLRGIDFIQVPTTLLSQVDSSIGGKTGVDFMQYKNMVGAFYQPKLVYMNLSTLKTLPERQIISGLGEILKHGLIKDASYFAWLMEHKSDILALDTSILEEMIYISCNIKREVVEVDSKEQGERALLNLGHTIGHAIEKLCNFHLYHGECVGLGIISAAYISMQLGNIDLKTFNSIEDCLRLFGFQTTVNGLNPTDVLLATKSDKKMIGNQIKFILLKEIGSAYIYRELTDEQILEGIRYVCK